MRGMTSALEEVLITLQQQLLKFVEVYLRSAETLGIFANEFCRLSINIHSILQLRKK